MLDYLHSEATLEPGDTVHVRLDSPANVMLMDDASFESYRRGEEFHYLGGWVSRAELTLWPPRKGRWHVVVDLGEAEGKVSATVNVIRT